MTITIDAAFIGGLVRVGVIIALMLITFTAGFFIGREDGRRGL